VRAGGRSAASDSNITGVTHNSTLYLVPVDPSGNVGAVLRVPIVDRSVPTFDTLHVIEEPSSSATLIIATVTFTSNKPGCVVECTAVSPDGSTTLTETMASGGTFQYPPDYTLYVVLIDAAGNRTPPRVSAAAPPPGGTTAPSSSGSSSSSTYAAIGGAIAGVLVAVAAAGAFVVWRRRRQLSRQGAAPLPMHSTTSAPTIATGFTVASRPVDVARDVTLGSAMSLGDIRHGYDVPDPLDTDARDDSDAGSDGGVVRHAITLEGTGVSRA
jgi:hypothetical protein